MNLVSQFFFLLLISISSFFIIRRISIIRRNISLAKKPFKANPNNETRIKNLLLLAFGQKKMFKKIIPAILHLFLYLGFIIINIEVVEIVIDGLFGTHRIFSELGMPYYNVFISIIEFFVITVLISCVILLVRRNLLNINRFKSRELKGWPTLDANLILIFEIILMLAVITLNTTDLVLQEAKEYPITGEFYFSTNFKSLFDSFSLSTILLVERISWWIHIIGILFFALYITYSKHLHIFLAFPNTYYTDASPLGKMKNMESITNEIKIMRGEKPDNNPSESITFGAKDIEDLSWKNLLDAYSCSECGRCTSVCPANITGKKLSPRKIMMDVRDRAEEIGKRKVKKLGDDNKNLVGDYISKEEILACTSCNACVEECPISINPLDIIIEIRRYYALEASQLPQEWNLMMQNIETNFSPWKFPIEDRTKWIDEIK